MYKTKHWGTKLLIGIFVVVSFGSFSQTTAYLLDPPPYFEGEVVLTDDSVVRIYADTSGRYYNISGTSALAALDAASRIAVFDYSTNDEWADSFGLLVYKIAGKTNEGYDGWQYWVNYPNEEIPMVSAENYGLEQGDTIDWFYGGYGINPDSAEMNIKLHIAIQEDTTPPIIEIISPKAGGMYLFGSEISILPLPFSIVLGELYVTINAYDEVSGVQRVELFIDDGLEECMFTPPYSCRVTGFGNGMHTLKSVAYDSVGNKKVAEMSTILLSN